MLVWLTRLLLGTCLSCREKQARIDSQERHLSDLLDRLMSRDYSHVAFVRAQAAAVTAQAETGDGEPAEDDGLDDG